MKERGFFFYFSMFFVSSDPTFGPHCLLAQTTFFDKTVLCPNLPCPRPPCAGSPVVLCVLWCGVGASKIWADSPPPNPPPTDRPKNRFFPSSATIFASVFLSWGSFRFVEFWWCDWKPGYSNVHVWAQGLSCETQAAFHVKNNFAIDCPPPP